MKIGDKVVCVDDSPCHQCGHKSNIIKGNVYVIKEMLLSYFGTPCVALLGIDAPQCHYSRFGEVKYRANRFRLLDELKQQTAQNQFSVKTSKKQNYE